MLNWHVLFCLTSSHCMTSQHHTFEGHKKSSMHKHALSEEFLRDPYEIKTSVLCIRAGAVNDCACCCSSHNSIDISHAGEIIADNGHINPSSKKTTPATTQFILTILFLFHNFPHLRPETVTGSPTQSRSKARSHSDADHEDAGNTCSLIPSPFATFFSPLLQFGVLGNMCSLYSTY